MRSLMVPCQAFRQSTPAFRRNGKALEFSCAVQSLPVPHGACASPRDRRHFRPTDVQVGCTGRREYCYRESFTEPDMLEATVGRVARVLSKLCLNERGKKRKSAANAAALPEFTGQSTSVVRGFIVPL